MEGVLPGGPGALGPGESMKKAGAEGRSCSSLMRGRQEKDHNGTRVTGFRPHSMRSIAIVLIRCKEKQLRPGRGGVGPPPGKRVRKVLCRS